MYLFSLSASSALIFIFLLPAIQVTFFCAAVGRDPTDLRVAVVNEEVSVNAMVIRGTGPPG